MAPRSKGPLAVPILVALSFGCTSWVAPPGSIEHVVRSTEIPRIRIRTSQETTVLQFPRILGDSLAGSTTTAKGMRILDERVTYQINEIEEFEVEEFDWQRTTLAIGAFLGAWFSLLGLAANSS